MSMQLFPIGQRVILDSDIEGTITGIMIRENNYIEYEVVWWDGRTRNCIWLQELEVATTGESGSLNIGFKG
jgi:hypothetical protein